MSFRMGLLIGGLSVAVVALAVAVVVLATGESGSPSPIAAKDEPCPVTQSGGSAELDLAASGLTCEEAQAIQATDARIAVEQQRTGVIEVSGWSCLSLPFSEYPLLTRCRKDGHRLDVLGTAPSAHPHMNPPPSAKEVHEATHRPKASAEPVIFQTPSENIGCRMEATRVACDIFRFDWSPPPVSRSCEQPSAWGHTIVLKTTGSTFICPDGPIVEPGPGTPILQYGKAVGIGPFACESREKALVCVAKSSRGIYLSQRKLKLF